MALFIAAFGLLVLVTMSLAKSIQYAEKGEKRILIAVAASLPFLLVRLIFSALAVFKNEKRFSLYNGDVTVLLCMALLEEVVVVVLYEGVGLTLKKEDKASTGQAQRTGDYELTADSSDKGAETGEREKGGWLGRVMPFLHFIS